MASRLADLSRAGEASQISPFPAPTKEKYARALSNPSYQNGNTISRIVGTSEKRLHFSPANNQSVSLVVPINDFQPLLGWKKMKK